MTIQEAQEEIIEEFSFLENRDDKIEYIIDMGKRLPGIDENFKVEEFRIKGCQSNVWLLTKTENGKMIFQVDSDAMVPKGIAAMLLRVFNNHSAEEIKNANINFMERIGMDHFLVSQRANGMRAMIQRFQEDAINIKE